MANPRIAAAFQRRQAAGQAALIPYVTTGDPTPEATLPIMHALVSAGADVIELGVPFSDPMADGPVIQRASERAIAQGMGLRGVIQVVRQFRQTDQQTPVVLMGYANPVERMGVDAFVSDAAEAGVDGVLIVDYPPEEAYDFARCLKAANLDPIFLLAPTSTDARIAQLAELAQGYVYYVALNGVTGAANLSPEAVAERVQHIQGRVSVPVGVGFGISSPESARAVAQHADAVVIGSRLILEMEKAVEGLPSEEKPGAAARAAEAWLRTIRQALNQESRHHELA